MNMYYTSPVMSAMDIAVFGFLAIIAGSLFWIALHHQMIPIYDEDEEYEDEDDNEEDK